MGADKESATYRRRLSDIADVSDGRVFFNRRTAHTSIAIATIIEKSDEYIYIITDDLDENIYCTPEIINALNKFLKGKITRDIKVISKSFIPLSHPWRSGNLGELYASQIFFLELPQDWAIAYYFVLGDGKNYRYENQDQSLVPVVQFGNPEMGGYLKRRFEELEVELKEKRRHMAV